MIVVLIYGYLLTTEREREREGGGRGGGDENIIKREVCFSRAILWYRVILVRYARSSFLSSTTSSSSPPCCSCARTLSPRANVRIYDTLYLGVAPVRTCIPTHCPTGDTYARTHARTHARTYARRTRVYTVDT